MKTKLESIETMAKDLIKYYIPEYSFVWDRSRRRKGQCRFSVKQIGVSKPLAEINTVESMLLTVTHEIAHALLPKDGHNKNWKTKCLEIGGDGKTYYDKSDTVMPMKKWEIFRSDGTSTGIKRFRRCTLREGYHWQKILK